MPIPLVQGGESDLGNLWDTIGRVAREQAPTLSFLATDRAGGGAAGSALRRADPAEIHPSQRLATEPPPARGYNGTRWGAKNLAPRPSAYFGMAPDAISSPHQDTFTQTRAAR